jgi:hypothetical protein
MTKYITALLIATLLAASAHAQIFPRIEKDDVKKRIAGGAAQPEEEPTEPTPEENPADVDGAAALRRYNELLSGYLKEEKAQRKAMTKHTDELFAGVRDYYEGVFLLRMGFYKDAERKLKDVGVSVRNEKDIATPELLRAAEEIKAGKAYYYRMIAAVMLEYTGFKTEKDAEAAWKKAALEGIKVRDELSALVDRGKVSDDDYTQEMTAWLLTAHTEWLKLFKAEQNLQDHPENLNTWLFVVGATGIRQDDKIEYTPNFLKQRAALTVIKEFWPESLWVKSAVIDAGLGQNRLQVGQLDDIETFFEKQPYHSVLGAAGLQKQLDAVKDALRQVEALKNK